MNAKRITIFYCNIGCFVCDGPAKNGANIRNADSTYVRVCDNCFERLWQELYQEPAVVVSSGEARVMEEQGQC